METILDRCRRLKIKLDPEVEKIAKLQIEIREVEDQREWLAVEREDTSAFDTVLEHLWSKLISLQATIDLGRSNPLHVTLSEALRHSSTTKREILSRTTTVSRPSH